MALIKLTAMVDAISGKLNGTIFSHNKGGQYVRSRSLVSNPQTTAQVLARSIFTTISQQWRELNEKARQAWIQAAGTVTYQNRLGDSKNYTGKALFQRINQNIQLVGGTLLDNPPEFEGIKGFTGAATPLQMAVDPSHDKMGIKAKYKIEADGPTTKYLVESTPGLSPGISNAKNEFRVVAVIDEPANGTSLDVNEDPDDPSTPVTDRYIEVFGVPAPNTKVFLRITPINPATGERGIPMQTFGVTVEAT